MYSAVFTLPPPLELSKAVKLKDVSFRLYGPNIQWLVRTLKAAKAESLQQIIIRASAGFYDLIGERDRQEWQDLDWLLVELWASRSIRPEIVLVTPE